MTKISLLGCGWLGLPLAKSLLKKGFEVKGSTTSDDKLSVLKENGIEPFKISLFEDKIEGNLMEFLKESEILIIDIPPKLRNPESDSFVSKIQKIIPFIEKSTIKNVIFISSTSVYGEDSEFVTEETSPKPITESGKQLVESEMLLQNNNHFKTTVIRFGGLIGEDRHPINFLSGRKNIENPDAPINLIHQEDCIGIILKIFEKKTWGETYNAVAPYHPSRKEYYTKKSVELNLSLPEFEENSLHLGKTILSNKIEVELKYIFLKPFL